MSYLYGYISNVVAIHPDRNLIFLTQMTNQKLMVHDMDKENLDAFHTLGHNYGSLTPYIPSFLNLVLTSIEMLILEYAWAHSSGN